MTLLEMLGAGIHPKRLDAVARDEDIDVQGLAEDILTGKTVIPMNPGHERCAPIGIGSGLRVKVNANIGSSSDFPDPEIESIKLASALEAGADTIMDLSTGGDITAIRRRLMAECHKPLGTVPIYQATVAAKEREGGIVSMPEYDFFKVLEDQAEDGVDFMTIHAGVNRNAVEAMMKQGRVTGIVSRGAAFIVAWMLHNDRENPYFEDFDRVLAILAEHDVTISLGDGFRPGCIADATDRAQITELVTLGDLVRRARAANVQAMVEGPGHVPFDQIEANVRLQKEVCDGAPFYVLGPLVTDITPGYDHITAAIGGTMAAYAGADFLCYVTPREHIGLPTVEDVRDGVIVSRIAAHAADIARGNPLALKLDRQMAEARKSLDWQKQIELALDPQKAAASIEERHGHKADVCSMCGDFCAMKILSEYMSTEESCI